MKTLSTVFSILIIAGVGERATAQDGSTVTQSVTIEVKPITKISVSGSPNALIINDAPAGADLVTVSDENTRYSVVTNLESMKIVASINNPMPSGTKLLINLGTSKGMSAGTVELTNAMAPVTVVSGISKTSDKDQSIRYTFAANADVGPIESDSRVILLTLTN